MLCCLLYWVENLLCMLFCDTIINRTMCRESDATIPFQKFQATGKTLFLVLFHPKTLFILVSTSLRQLFFLSRGQFDSLSLFIPFFAIRYCPIVCFGDGFFSLIFLFRAVSFFFRQPRYRTLQSCRRRWLFSFSGHHRHLIQSVIKQQQFPGEENSGRHRGNHQKLVADTYLGINFAGFQSVCCDYFVPVFDIGDNFRKVIGNQQRRIATDIRR